MDTPLVAAAHALGPTGFLLVVYCNRHVSKLYTTRNACAGRGVGTVGTPVSRVGMWGRGNHQSASVVAARKTPSEPSGMSVTVFNTFRNQDESVLCVTKELVPPRSNESVISMNSVHICTLASAQRVPSCVTVSHLDSGQLPLASQSLLAKIYRVKPIM
ncbi:hypothetical protein J6590_012277 [Homalodisca vitripennis]|nr:hypothetical protein J6590_012277 [Homalodisca vitripennis]